MRYLLILMVACAKPPPPVAPSAPPVAIAKPCEGADHRQLDFWIGDWSVAVHSRATPTSDTWTDQRGTQHVTPTLSGCAIEEHFSADPPAPWSGRSFSAFDAITKKWRQTWVDDSGGYLVFVGGPDGPEGNDFTFVGEPRDFGGKPFQMRMVFSKITHDALHWEWQRTEDAWATHTLLMAIDYTRLAAR